MLQFAWRVGSTIVLVMLGLALGAAHHPTPLSEKARVYLCAYLY
jgi:hypothetical protein